MFVLYTFTLGEIELYQANPLIEDIIHLGGWPVIEGSDWNEKSFDWITMTGKMKSKGFNHNILLAIFVGPDFKESTKNRAQVNTFKYFNVKTLLPSFSYLNQIEIYLFFFFSLYLTITLVGEMKVNE